MKSSHELSKRTLLLGTGLSIVVLSNNALASSGAHHEPSLSDLTFYWINFALYIVGMTFLLRKPIKNGWAARAARIKQTVTQCADEVAIAERELNAIEALSKGLATEQENVRKELLSQANLEAQEIIKQANQRAQRIREQGKELLKGEARSAQSSFRASLVRRAIVLARERFAKGEFSARETAYLEAAVARAKQMPQDTGGNFIQ